MKEKIVIFTVDNCPKCKILKEKMNKAEILYEENNDISEVLSLGFLSAPILKVEEDYLSFKEAVGWITNKTDPNKYAENIYSNIKKNQNKEEI